MLESLSQPVPPLSTQCLNIRGKLLRRAWDQLHLRDLEDPQLQALEWLGSTAPADRYAIEESGSARYGYKTGYARTGPHLDLHMDNLPVDPPSFLWFKTRSNTSLTFVVDRRECT